MQTPPSQTARAGGICICDEQSVAASSISTLTASVHSSQSAHNSLHLPNKRAEHNAAIYYQSPSPKKAAPNFDITPSDDNSLFSSDDEDGWAQEEEKIMARVALQLAQEEQDAEDKDDEHLPELYKFQLGQEGNPDTINDGDPTAEVVITVIVNVKKTK